MVRQLAYSTELLVCINQSRKQYKQRGGEKTLLNSTLHTQALSTALSHGFSLCVFTLLCSTPSQLFNEHICKSKGHKSCHDLCPPFCVLHHVSSGRLGIPTCIWWDIVCLHLLTVSIKTLYSLGLNLKKSPTIKIVKNVFLTRHEKYNINSDCKNRS